MTLTQHILDFRRSRCRLEALTLDAISIRVSNAAQANAILSAVIVEAQDSWSWACRQLVLTSSTGKAITRTGRKIVRARTTSLGAGIEFLRHNWGLRSMGKNWEPDWFMPANTIRAATLLNLPNLNEITVGLGAALVHEQLRAARNVVAHSLPNTWAKLRLVESAFLGGNFLKPTDFIIAINPTSGRRYIFEWLEELEICLQWAAD